MSKTPSSQEESNLSSDAVPAPVRALLTVFEGALSGVTFPGVDGDSLVTTAARMDEISGELSKAAAAVDRLRDELQEQRNTLLRDAKKALEYARVFASDQPELKETVDAIDLESCLEGPKKKRARRSPKRKAKETPAAAEAAAEGEPSKPEESDAAQASA